MLYEPADPAPQTAPVVVYFHGAQISDQRGDVDAELRHFAGRGSIVLYAEEGTVNTAGYRDAGRRAVLAGMAELARPGHVRPSGRIAFVGFSLGGMVALQLANEPKGSAVPRPGVVVLHDPAGECSRLVNGTVSDGTLTNLPRSVKLLIIQAETSVGSANSAAPGAWRNSLVTTKNWLVVPSDDYGEPPMVSDHAGSTGVTGGGSPPLDAIDWWGYWRPTDRALESVFSPDRNGYDVFCRKAGASCDPVRDMGRWADGHAAQRISFGGTS